MYSFKTITIIESKIDNVFEFFCNAENLQKLTPPSLDFKIITKIPFKLKKGSIIDYRIKLYGVALKWKTEITNWDPPYRFEDSQLKGPYKIWKHSHIFNPIGNKTEMIDIVKYIPKGWPFTFLINNLFVKKEIEKIFYYRTQKIIEIFN